MFNSLSPRRVAAVSAAAASALALAACGSSASSSSSTTTDTSAATPAASTPAATPASSTARPAVATAKGAAGVYLTGARGRAIYLWVADSRNRSVCSGACAKVWPPVTAGATPSAGGGAHSSELGTITRADGIRQLTYNGHPLYYYVADQSAQSTTGQGSGSFGAKWWLVSPAGAAITGSSSSASGGTSSSGGGW